VIGESRLLARVSSCCLVLHISLINFNTNFNGDFILMSHAYNSECVEEENSLAVIRENL